MTEIILNKNFQDWNLLIQELEKNKTESKIYRGQSNYFDPHKKKFHKWNIESSFNRFYGINFYNFRTFLFQQLNNVLFQKSYESYSYKEMKLLIDAGQLERLYYLQHYGIPTCFIDFTKNPLIASYFAITSVKGDNAGVEDDDGNIQIYPNDCFVTIYEIDFKMLMKLGVKTIQENDFPKNYDKFNIASNYIGLDLNPAENCSNIDKIHNLQKQESCFILYDNFGSTLNFETFINSLIRRKSISLEKPIITAYHLDYNGIFKRLEYNNKKTTLFRFLEMEKFTGKYLFDDIQGLKYDFNYFHH
ncbi:FRG domain-containing protein [Bacteroidota bacterium]